MERYLINNLLPSPIYFSEIFSSSQLITYCQSNSHRVVIVTDTNVNECYADTLLHYLRAQAIHVEVVVIAAGEASKSRETKSYIEDRLFALGCGRDTVLIALGGGVVTDLTGFVAATYCRGIPVIYIPTSLLAMVDAAIGGKTGINTKFGKNTLGTFTHPKFIFIDVTLLNTLPDNEYKSAFAEIIKHAVIADEDYFSLLEENIEKIKSRDEKYLQDIILKSCEIKASIVAEDKTECHKREILNFGHTIAHALEKATDYRLSHGHAVFMGMIAEAWIANKLEYLSTPAFARIEALIAKMMDTTHDLKNVTPDAILAAFKFDKKNRKEQSRFVLLKSIGQTVQEDGAYAHVVEMSVVKEALEYLYQP
jgi:3-dehydroquinate synthase